MEGKKSDSVRKLQFIFFVFHSIIVSIVVVVVFCITYFSFLMMVFKRTKEK